MHLARTHEALITIEEGAIGGFASHVAHLLATEGVFDKGLKFRSMVLPDIFIDQASPEAMYRVAGMEAPQIEAKVLETLGVAVAGEKGVSDQTLHPLSAHSPPNREARLNIRYVSLPGKRQSDACSTWLRCG